MNIPTANTIIIDVKPAVILNDNSDSIITENVEPRQLTNQIATFEINSITSLQPHSSNSILNNYIKIKIIFLLALLCYIGALFFIIHVINSAKNTN